MVLHPKFSTLVDALRYRAQHELPGGYAYAYLTNGAAEDQRISYADLDRRARTIAARLQGVAKPGSRAVLLYAPDLEYIAAFFGCLYAGVIAVPAYPPDPGRLARTLPRLQAIFRDADADFVLTTQEIAGLATFLFTQAPDLEKKCWLTSDALDPALADAWAPVPLTAEDIAFLQYTSGSTGAPKGVVLSHGNLLHNLELISNAFRIDEDSVGVSWLPPYHDMGLIGGILAPLYKGRPTAVMSPVAFLQRPLSWLEAITRFRATISGAPNFAYELCVRKVTPSDLERLDLHSWSVAFTGAEPVRPDTLDAFVRTFGPRGFARSAFYPCYGLAEATLIVSGGDKGAEPVVETVEIEALQSDRVVRAPRGGPATKRIAGCGRGLGDQRVVVVNPVTSELSLPGDVGELWVAGPSVARGYWRQEEATRDSFEGRIAGTDEGPFLRTGDLAFLRDGEVFITGRLKDLVIIRGRNYYPQDIERTVEASHPSLRRGCCAAFAVDLQGQERLIVAVEIERRYRERRSSPSSPPQQSERRGTDRREGLPSNVEEAAKQTSTLGADGAGPFDPDEVCDTIRRAVLDQHELSAHEVMLVKPGAIPKTSSGKIQRHACRQGYFDGSLEQVASSVISVEQTRRTSIRAGDLRDVVRRLGAAERAEWLERFIKEQLAKAVKTPVSRVDAAVPLSTFGLDSLLAVELAHRIEKRLGVTVPVTAFLRDATLTDLVASVDAGLTVEPHAAVADPTATVTSLAAGQEALWFLHQLAPSAAAYNVSCTFRIVSQLDIDALKGAFEHLGGRHEALRTTYRVVDGKPTRVVSDRALLDFAQLPATPRLEEALAEEANRPFDIERGPIVRVRVHASPAGHVVQLVMHHIGADLWSMVVLLNELGKAYDAIAGGRPVPLPAVQPAYTDFVQWQRDYLAGPAAAAASAYWRKRHAAGEVALELPTDRPRPPVQTHRGATHVLSLDPGLVARLRDFARARSTTPYVVLLSAFGALLSRYSGQPEVVVGSPVAGRPRADFGRAVGYFVNVLAMRVDTSDDPSFAALVAAMRADVLDALENQHYPLSHIVDQLGARRDPSRSPMFQAFLAFEKTHLEKDEAISHVVLGVPGATARLGGLEVQAVTVEQSTAQFDLTLVAVEGRSSMSARFQYNTDLFDASTIARMDTHLCRLLDVAMADPAQRIGELTLLTAAERERIIRGWNATRTEVPSACVHQLVEAQVRSTPNAVAVELEGTRLRYAELNCKANQLAHWLRRRGVGRDVRVGVCMERSLELVVALLAVLKAGGAYVPLDPGYPAERLAFMIDDARVPVLLTQQRLCGRIPDNAAEMLSVDTATEQLEREPGEDLPAVNGPADLAYVIYTSGSTGKPKGAMNVHRGLVNRLLWMQSAYAFDARDCFLQKTPFSFDVSVWEFFSPLLAGARLLLARPDGHRDPEYLARLIEDRGVTVVHFVASMLRTFVDHIDAGRCRGLRHVITSGEAVKPETEERYFAKLDAPLHNLYGPTEASIDVTSWDCERDRRRRTVPIGRPIANTQMYVLDERMKPVPVGVTGEIHIGGVGVARGYWNRPELTAERFVRDPFSPDPEARLYKTGDLGRWLPEGALECLGRMDDQVKVRGFRIELGEVEAALAEHPQVRDVVVVARPDERNDTQLVAYVVADAATASLSTDLREYSKTRLPEYMVPSAFVPLDRLPLLPNGKKDRRALPAPPRLASAEFVAPRSPLEEEVCSIVRDVLGVENVGVHSSFFELGGHSLLLTQLANRLRARFEVELPLAELFENATVAGMALAVTKARAQAADGDLGAILSEVESLSPEELDRLLGEKVKLG